VVRLAKVLSDSHTTPQVTLEVRAALDRLAAGLTALKTGDQADLAQARYLAEIIQNRAYDKLAALAQSDDRREVTIPPGMPIGADEGEACWFCEPVRW
jgi:hypothetical protein